MKKPACMACGSDGPLQLFQLCVDGQALRVQPSLCDACGDALIIRVGFVLGEMLRNGPSPFFITPAERRPAPPTEGGS